MAAISSLFNSRNMNATANRSNWSTIMSYLKSHSSFLGLKQDRFTILSPSGLPDYSIEIVNNEQVRKVKVNRPKALCFDYLQLKDSFGLELETEIISDRQEIMEDNQMGQKHQMHRHQTIYHNRTYPLYLTRKHLKAMKSENLGKLKAEAVETVIY